MQPMTMIYSPTDEQTKFFSEEQAVRYARGAGYSVKRDDEGTIVASRPDVKDDCVLRAVGDKFRWSRR